MYVCAGLSLFQGEERMPLPLPLATPLGSIVGGSIIFGSELTAPNNEPTFRVFKFFTPKQFFVAGLSLLQGGAYALSAPPWLRHWIVHS